VAPAKRPVTVTIAVVLQWIAAVIAIISGFDLIAAAFEMRRSGVATQLEAALVNQGIVDVPGSAIVVAVFAAGTLLLAIAVVRVMVALYLARGRNWARIVVAVFVLINMAGGLAYLFEGYWVHALTVVVIEALVLWLLFNHRSNEFFRAAA
jgi:hypothetical protein